MPKQKGIRKKTQIKKWKKKKMTKLIRSSKRRMQKRRKRQMQKKKNVKSFFQIEQLQFAKKKK